ncbi:hypothetical protein C8F01DRAFT_1225807 [Mycena amicta]|nr:hypothetical protein C8F01DRAFT_1225807 [Mycena amicta]
MASKIQTPDEVLPVYTPLPPGPGNKQYRRRDPFGCKFGVGFILGCLLWLVAEPFIKRPALNGSQQAVVSDEESESWPIYADDSHRTPICVDWHETDADAGSDPMYPFSAQASFELPVDADNIFLLTRSRIRKHPGAIFSAGSVEVLQTSARDDTIKVDVTAQFRNHTHLEASRVCRLERRTEEAEEHGVGIFTKWTEQDESHRRWNHTYPELRFKITVSLPSRDSSLFINKFSTDLEVYAQIFRDMSRVQFGELNLSSVLQPVFAGHLSAWKTTVTTSLAPIQIQNLISDHAELSTSVSQIEGIYNARSLKLTSAGGALDVAVNLFNNPHSDGTATLHLSGAAAPINATVNLIQTDAELYSALVPIPHSRIPSEAKPLAKRASFNITAHTTAASLDLHILSAPIESLITVNASNMLAPAHISLPPTYEGRFHARTTMGGTVDVEVLDDDVEDPKGEGRKRWIGWGRSGSRDLQGYVHWGEKPDSRKMGMGTMEVENGLGMVEVENVMAPVLISL